MYVPHVFLVILLSIQPGAGRLNYENIVARGEGRGREEREAGSFSNAYCSSMRAITESLLQALKGVFRTFPPTLDAVYCVKLYAHIYVYIYLCIYIYVYMYICIHIHFNVYMYIHVCIYISIYIYIVTSCY